MYFWMRLAIMFESACDMKKLLFWEVLDLTFLWEAFVVEYRKLFSYLVSDCKFLFEMVMTKKLKN